MGEPQSQIDRHPFDEFKSAMRKLINVPKSELDEKLKAHNEQKPERRAGRKPTRRKVK